MRSRITRHLEWLRTLSMLPFSLVLAAYVYVLRLVPVIIVAMVVLVTETNLPVIDVSWYWPIIIAPIVETLVFQWLPIGVAFRLTSRAPVALWVSTVLFSIAHYDAGVLTMIIAAPAGLVLAWAFIVQRDKGVWPALLATALVHMWVNLAALGLRLVTN